MPVQIRMNTNLSNSSTPPTTSSNKSKSLGSLNIRGRSNDLFQNSMIERIHLSKPGCSSCGH